MSPTSLRAIREEHASLAAVLQSLRLMLDRGPGDDPAAFFDVMRAMLFYIDEVPERQHHPKESEWLFPKVAERSAEAAQAIERLERDHAGGEAAVRELQHLLLAWELMGAVRRDAFATALLRYIDFYLEHMRLEEAVVLPAAQQHLTAQDWAVLDAAFAGNSNPLASGQVRDPAYDRLFTRIVQRAPSPIGLG
ncbi:MAG: hemerythrin domain-containing protein [Acidovorax sp.]|uniref:hemerythrin domain-containing protein n=1 Tax=Acidovorax sp. TaxID=1872122 RepID=UPI002627D19D|nr:hemerythrin domain-containing protein [Acidovorax sp.]MDH4424847.1 hemerythrin domain-containing protein [Acidovorax sp.]MDH4465661.1 hemerythrin domain-containing protein [Acidovorax sp.]